MSVANIKQAKENLEKNQKTNGVVLIKETRGCPQCKSRVILLNNIKTPIETVMYRCKKCGYQWVYWDKVLPRPLFDVIVLDKFERIEKEGSTPVFLRQIANVIPL